MQNIANHSTYKHRSRSIFKLHIAQCALALKPPTHRQPTMNKFGLATMAMMRESTEVRVAGSAGANQSALSI